MNHVVIYFEAVKFNGSLPPNAPKLASPTIGFSGDVELSSTYLSRLLKGPDREHFALGDRYDLLLDEGHVATVILATLIGAEGDEGTGNDSYIGALAKIQKDDLIFFRKDNYVLRRHHDLAKDDAKHKFDPSAVYAGLLEEPIRFDIQTKIVNLLTLEMNTRAKPAEIRAAHGIPPTFAVQGFRLADGSTRFYAREAWTLGEEKTQNRETAFALGAWVSPSPEVHILSLEPRTSGYPFFVGVLPSLLNVIDLGGGKTGLIISTSWDDSSSLQLLEFRDGANISQMPVLRSRSAGE